MTPLVEGRPTKPKEAPSPYEVRLVPLETNWIFPFSISQQSDFPSELCSYDFWEIAMRKHIFGTVASCRLAVGGWTPWQILGQSRLHSRTPIFQVSMFFYINDHFQWLLSSTFGQKASFLKLYLLMKPILDFPKICKRKFQSLKGLGRKC